VLSHLLKCSVILMTLSIILIMTLMCGAGGGSQHDRDGTQVGGGSRLNQRVCEASWLGHGHAREHLGWSR
jgi:hypothetical protein